MIRRIRLPNKSIQLLRDLRDSYRPPRPIPSLVNAALRGTRNKNVEKTETATRKDSMAILVTLDDEFKDLPHAEIVARVLHALIGLDEKILPEVISDNRK